MTDFPQLGGPPIIDPTKLTTDAVNAAKEEFRRELKSTRELLEARLDAMDEATKLRLVEVTRFPTDVDRQLGALRDVQDEKFGAIARQFIERDTRTDQAARASKEALDAALQAAKELVGQQGESSAAAATKSETSFTKQIDAIGLVISTQEKALLARLEELKERIDRGDGTLSGARAGISSLGTIAFGSILILLNVIAVVVTIVLHK